MHTKEWIAVYILILNPYSGRGLALKRLPEIEAVLREQNLSYRIEQSHEEHQTSEVARRCAAEQPEGIIVLGGDGTLFRVVNGMAGSSVPLIFVSCGTGNDFVRSLNLPSDPIEALRCQLAAPVTSIDVGRMNDICFLNVSGTGFDVDVLRCAERHKEKHTGLVAYMLGLIDAVKRYRPTTALVSFDDEPEQEQRFAILSVGNGRYFGGGMRAVPDAIVNDGLFDVVVVTPVRRFVILPLIILYITGKHVKCKLATLRRCKKLTIRRKGTTFNLDGELMDEDIAHYELLPAALRVRIPSLG